MKLISLMFITGFLSANVYAYDVYAYDTELEMLAGIEAGIDSNTAMMLSDIEKTQKILSSNPIGAEESWYNLDTTTHFKVKINQHYYNDNNRPCISYQLETKHSSQTLNRELAACKNYDNNWISVIKVTS